MLRREYLLPQIGRKTQFVLLPIHKVVQIGLHEDCLLDSVAVGLGMKHLLDLVVNWVLLHFSKPEISWIDWPVIGTLLLLPRIVIFM